MSNSLEDDKASRELIKKMMEDDEIQEYYGVFDNSEESGDEDYKPGMQQRMRNKPKKPKVLYPVIEIECGVDGAKEPKRRRVGKWSEDEHTRFLEGLNRYGRDWKSISELIETRTPKMVSSYAKKHFISLVRTGVPLPEKVAESGIHYTTSGKAPVIGTDLANRLRDGICMLCNNNELIRISLQRKAAIFYLRSKGLLVPISDPSAELKHENNAPEPEMEIPIETKAIPNKRKREPKIELTEVLEEQKRDAMMYKSRLRKKKANYHSMLESDTNEELCMLPVLRYREDNVQPFLIEVTSTALLMMDVHAHLSMMEIIGFLAGKWDATSKKLTVVEAYPCEAVSTNQTYVELDPASEISIRQKVKDANLIIVGWYHSHPFFKAQPSERDIKNQENYQQLFTGSPNQGIECGNPFVGAIVSPYDRKRCSYMSEVTWFHVKRNTSVGGAIPMNLDVEYEDDGCNTEAMMSLVGGYIGSHHAVDLTNNWSYSHKPSEEAGSEDMLDENRVGLLVKISNMTYANKCLLSLKEHRNNSVVKIKVANFNALDDFGSKLLVLLGIEEMK